MELVSKNLCTGCMACVNSCNNGCIDIVIDESGQEYPQINNSKCIQCGLCIKACPKINTVTSNMPDKAFACWSLSNDVRSKSASGGAAAEFYKYAVSNGYYICGSKYFADFRVGHYLTNNIDEIINFQSSKYVFSQTNEVYRDIKKVLNSGEKVLFISLPCKVAGLLAYLGKEYCNLITVDIVCHGVPPYKQLKEHIDFVDKNKCATVLNFRKNNEFMFRLSNGEKSVYSKIGRTDLYLAAFLEGINYRESCYSCEYACKNRVADITIGDFWGLGIDKPFNHPYSGSISEVLLNTDKGKDFFSKANSNLFSEEREVEEAVKWNAQLKYPTPVHELRENFLESIKGNSFDDTAKSVLSDIVKKANREEKMKIVNRIKNHISRYKKGN